MYVTTLRMATNKKEKASVGEDMEKLELSCIADGNVKWYSCYGKQYGSSSKKLKNRMII